MHSQKSPSFLRSLIFPVSHIYVSKSFLDFAINRENQRDYNFYTNEMHWIQYSFFKKILRMRDREERFRVCLDCAYFCWNWKHCSEIIFKCVNSAVGPIFNKKLLKSVICRTVNSAHMHCSQLTKSTIAGWTKKKEKKREKRRGETHTPLSLQSEQSLKGTMKEREIWGP